MKPTLGRIVYFTYKGDDKAFAAIVSDVPEIEYKQLPEGALCWINVTYFWHSGGAAGWTWTPFFETEEAARKSGGTAAWWPPRVEG